MAPAQKQARLGEQLGPVAAQPVNEHHRGTVAPRCEPASEREAIDGAELNRLQPGERPVSLGPVRLAQLAAGRVEVATGRGDRAPDDRADGEDRETGRDVRCPTGAATRGTSGAQWLPRPLTTTGTVFSSKLMS